MKKQAIWAMAVTMLVGAISAAAQSRTTSVVRIEDVRCKSWSIIGTSFRWYDEQCQNGTSIQVDLVLAVPVQGATIYLSASEPGRREPAGHIFFPHHAVPGEERVSLTIPWVSAGESDLVRIFARAIDPRTGRVLGQHIWQLPWLAYHPPQ